MNIIIAGSRHLPTPEQRQQVAEWIFAQGVVVTVATNQPITVICGMAKGIDTFGEEVAKFLGWGVQYFPADWSRFGKRAGHLRNEAMAEVGNELWLVWDGKSPGSKNMRMNAEKRGLVIRELVL